MDVNSYITISAGNKYVITVPSNATYRSTSTGTPALRCANNNGSITLVVQAGATIYGKGGTGG